MAASGLLGTGPHGTDAPANTAYVARSAIYLLPNGKQSGSREITTAFATRGQYAFDVTGTRKGMRDAEHLAIIALRTELGSSCDPGLGSRFHEVAKVTDAFPEEQKQRVNEALSMIVDKNLLEILSITASATGSRGDTRIHAKDLSDESPIDLSV